MDSLPGLPVNILPIDSMPKDVIRLIMRCLRFIVHQRRFTRVSKRIRKATLGEFKRFESVFIMIGFPIVKPKSIERLTLEYYHAGLELPTRVITRRNTVLVQTFVYLGDTDMLEIMVSVWTQDIIWNVFMWAVQAGQMIILEWMNNKQYRPNPNVKLCTMASQYGHLSILIWLHEHQYPWTEEACIAAARGGHLDCLTYVHRNGCSWSAKTRAAARRPHIIKYLDAEHCPK